jgi:hypothetical protein
VYDLAVTEAISNVLAQTDYPGLSGGELVAVLKHAKVFEFEDGDGLAHDRTFRDRADRDASVLQSRHEPR